MFSLAYPRKGYTFTTKLKNLVNNCLKGSKPFPPTSASEGCNGRGVVNLCGFNLDKALATSCAQSRLPNTDNTKIAQNSRSTWSNENHDNCTEQVWHPWCIKYRGQLEVATRPLWNPRARRAWTIRRRPTFCRGVRHLIKRRLWIKGDSIYLLLFIYKRHPTHFSSCRQNCSCCYK